MAIARTGTRAAAAAVKATRTNGVCFFTSSSWHGKPPAVAENLQSQTYSAPPPVRPVSPPPPPPPRSPPPARRQTPAQPSAQQEEQRKILLEAVAATTVRHDWTRKEIAAIYYQPLLELAFQAAQIHRRFHNPAEVQLCTLMNIKTGGCSEDCSYCAQSSRHQAGTGLAATRMESVDAVLAKAREARDRGSTRFCMGAAWRDMRGRKSGLARIQQMVAGVRDLGMESCVTLGMIDAAQARALRDAGLTAYNHNVDTSREFYPSVVSTRTYDERLQTLAHVRDAGINVCSGGILGLGESAEDRIGLLHTVATLPAHPESFPVNALVPIKGTPLGDGGSDGSGPPPLKFPSMLRTIAAARILMPATIVRIAAGRTTMTDEQQALCFMAGANAIFTGEKMLTTDCNGWDEDEALFGRWGLEPMKSFDKTPPAEDEKQGTP